MIKVLVTGSSGALGQAVIAQLGLIDNVQIYTVGRNPVSHVFKHFIGDLCDSAQISRIFNEVQPNFALHLAAKFTGSLDEMFAINVQAARNLLDEAKKSSIKTKVILTGSAAEYGVVSEIESPIREDHLLQPVSAYGVTKAWQTQLMGLYCSQGVDVLVARVFNLSGPGIAKNLFFGKISHQINEILAGNIETIEIGPLSAVRDYISTEDAADLILAVMRHGEPGEIYHVASGHPITMRNLLKKELQRATIDFSVVREENKNSNRTGYDVPVIYADMTKTLKLLEQNKKV